MTREFLAVWVLPKGGLEPALKVAGAMLKKVLEAVSTNLIEDREAFFYVTHNTVPSEAAQWALRAQEYVRVFDSDSARQRTQSFANSLCKADLADVPFSPSSTQNYGRKGDGLTRAVANMIYRGCVKREFTIPACCQKPADNLVVLLDQLVYSTLEDHEETLDTVVMILLEQPVRHDLPVDAYGEAPEGHRVKDWIYACHQVHEDRLQGIDANLPEELTPTLIGKTELQAREGLKGRWPGIVPAAIQALGMIQACWTHKLVKLFPWVSKNWSLFSGTARL